MANPVSRPISPTSYSQDARVNSVTPTLKALTKEPKNWLQDPASTLIFQSYSQDARGNSVMPVFNHFDKYLVRGYTNAAGHHVPPRWGPEMWSVYKKVLENQTRTTDKLEACTGLSIYNSLHFILKTGL